MRRFTLLVLLCWAVGWSAHSVHGFSLTGPAATWMTQRLGYNLNAQGFPPGQGWGFGGPMNLGEQYRFNFPEVTYGFSAAFQHYFGARGIAEIEKAIAIMNVLPDMNAIRVDNYPLTSLRINHRAQALQLADIRSWALGILVNELGLTDPTRWVFSLRNRWTPTPTSTNYFVVKRNFDPDTWQYTSFINGELWTYVNIFETQAGESFLVNQPVDPLALGGLINLPVASALEGNFLIPFGGFYTGLTRDDVGGLRYIYRHNNYNVETAPTNSVGAGTAAVSSSGGSSPWTIPVYGTNTTGTAIPGTSSNFVNQALRPGVGGVKFVRIRQESQLGAFPSNTVSFADTYVTNGVEQTQTLVRVQQAPDILFDAGDLQGADTFANGFIAYQTASLPWATTANGTTAFGPGVISPSVGATPSLIFTFSTVGPTIINAVLGGANFLSEENSLGTLFLWGSYDGSTDEPIVYPDTTSIQTLEAFILGGGEGGSGGSTSSSVDVWTPATIVLLPPGTTTTTTTGTTTGGTGTTMP